MMKTGMLIISNPQKYSKFIPRIQKEIKDTLYIHFVSKNQNLILGRNSRARYGPSFSSTMINFYTSSVCVRDLDVRVLLQGPVMSPPPKIPTSSPIDVVYYDEDMSKDVQTFLQDCLANRASDCQSIAVKTSSGAPITELQPDIDEELYDYVVLGGTFDRLHLGHKILLSEAILRCRKKLTVGVTDTEMLKTKKLWELIEPCETRISKVKDFLLDVEPLLEYNVVPISDMYGPTRTDPDFQMLVVSNETVKGGRMVNEERLKNGLNPLVVHSVELINDFKCHEIEEDKISSSNDRLRTLGLKLDKPINTPNRPLRPYVIGLCGGIASGKSSISLRLKNLGAGVINCDQIAHDLYKFGENAYFSIIEHFGKGILDENNEISRKLLGNIVFNDKSQLEKLNSILWPEILKKCEGIIHKLFKDESKDVIVLDAAVLLLAGWDKSCHEVWTCIIPQDEAITRLRERNNLSKEEAVSRISAQPTNLEQVEKAHVVFCTLWTPEYTQKQVEKAWDELQTRINS